MPRDGEQLYAAYVQLDAVHVAKGGPATSLAWLHALESFWHSGKLRMVVRKGRQVGASTIIAPRVVVATCLFGENEQARGTRGTFGLSSTRQKEADERLYNIERAFFDVGIRVKVRGDTIEIPKRPVIIQSFPSTSDVARGANSWGWWEDEMPAWRDGDGANPAAERDAAIVPTGLVHENFRIYSLGTPLGSGDFHAKLVELGDTEHQAVFGGPSWHWNPTITIERTRELQPDERLWRREFAAIPSEGASNIFSPELIAEANEYFTHPIEQLSNEVLIIDASSGRKDAWTWALGSWWRRRSTDEDAYLWETRTLPNGSTVRAPRRGADGHFEPNPEWQADPPPIFMLRKIGGIEGRFASHVSGEDIVESLARLARANGVETVVGDQREALMIEAAFMRHKMRFFSVAYTAQNKGPEGVAWITRLLRERRIKIEPHERMRRELLTFQEKITSTGSIQYSGRTSDDYACLLITAALADGEGHFRGSPQNMKSRGISSSGPGVGELPSHRL